MVLPKLVGHGLQCLKIPKKELKMKRNNKFSTQSTQKKVQDLKNHKT